MKKQTRQKKPDVKPSFIAIVSPAFVEIHAKSGLLSRVANGPDGSQAAEDVAATIARYRAMGSVEIRKET